jgi:hypothetical protein
VIRVSSKHNFKNDLHNPAEDCDPNIHYKTPKIISEGSWIFKKENECVAGQHNKVEEYHALGSQCQF